MTGWWLAAVLAVAAEPDVGRAHGALAAGHPPAARAAALQALVDEPSDGEAWAVYLDASAAAGLGDLAVRELAAAPEPPRPPSAESRELGHLLAGDDTRTALTYARVLRDRIDTRPDALLPLFELAAPGRRLEREQARVLRQVGGAVDRHADDVAWLHRALRVLAHGDPEPARAAVAHLSAIGEPAAPPRSPWTSAQREAAAAALASGGPFPGMYPGEARDVVGRAAARMARDGDGEGGLALWAQLRETDRSPGSALGHARLALDHTDADSALALADEAVRLAAAPTRDDLGCNLRADRAHRLAAALDVRGEASRRAHQLELALQDAGLAGLLRDGVVDPDLADALAPFSETLAAVARSRHAGRRGSAMAVATRRAGDAVASGDADAALGYTDDVLVLLGAHGGTPSVADTVAEALEARARALLALGDPEGALVAASAADVVSPWDVRSLATLRAELHEALGHRDAAWVAWALVRALDGDADAALRRTYRGPADPLAIASAHVRHPPGDPAEDADDPPPQEPDAALPVPGERMPRWAFDTEWGAHDDRGYRGRIYLFTVFSAGCEACLQRVRSSGEMARALRRDGHDVAMVALSADEDGVTWPVVAGWAERWGAVGRDPALAAQLGAWALPVTWVVDADGVVRDQLPGGDAARLEASVYSLFRGVDRIHE